MENIIKGSSQKREEKITTLYFEWRQSIRYLLETLSRKYFKSRNNFKNFAW